MRLSALSICIIVFLSVSCDKGDEEVQGCTNEYATNYDVYATIECNACCEFKQGDVVFWADSSSFVRRCDPDYSINIVNTKTGEMFGPIHTYAEVEPATCDSGQQNYIRLDVGRYKYETTTTEWPMCEESMAGPEFIVKEGCNIIRVL